MNEDEIRQLYSKLTKTLIKKNLTITTMESATSGQIASLITDTEGSSAILKGAFITYSNEAKIKAGVPKEVIEKYSVYSKETAEQMAAVCAREYNADIGIGVTGTMGNIDPQNPESSVPGQVYFGISFKGQVEFWFKSLPVCSSRYAYKLEVAKEVVMVLLEKLKD